MSTKEPGRKVHEHIIGGLRYDTSTAQLLASDRYWDGSNWERQGRNTYLYKTPNGRFFTYHTTQWQGERDYIEPVEKPEARELWERLPEKEASYLEAFGNEPEEA